MIERFVALRRLRWSPRGRRRVEPAQQLSALDCGPACLRMVLEFHGREVQLEEVRRAAGVSRGGVSAFALLEAARGFGLRARGVQVRAADLRQLPLPAILHWEQRHFVVLERWRSGEVVIVDPKSGRRRVRADELAQAFTGIAITCEPSDSFEREARPSPTLWPLVTRGVRRSRTAIPILAASLVLQLLMLALPIATGLIVDAIVPRGDADLLGVVTAGLLGAVCFNGLVLLCREQLLLVLRVHLDLELTLGFLHRLVRLPYQYFQMRPAGDLLMRLHSNAEIGAFLMSRGVSSLIDGLMAMIAIVGLLVLSPLLGVVVLALGLVQAIPFVITRTRARALKAAELEVASRSHTVLVQNLSGIETLKAMGMEERALDRWSEHYVATLNRSIARGRMDAWVLAFGRGFEAASLSVVLCLGAHLVLVEQISLGLMLALNALAASFFLRFGALVATASERAPLAADMERVAEVRQVRTEQEGERHEPSPPLAGAISLREISFRYAPADPDVLRSVTLDVEAGSSLALVGESGSGKSTLARLLLGLVTPTAGRIEYDGRNLATLDHRTVRKQLGSVMQAPFLFSGTVRENIAMSDPSLSSAAVVRAAKLAAVHEDVLALPRGYETLLVDAGASLSGGQRQRIALARALVAKPRILLLDEATSALDAITEQRVAAALETLQCTRIVIAHRLSTVMSADQIVVLERGEVVERGTHRELLAMRGTYFRLVSAQLDAGAPPIAAE